jgi:hypothetical protein
MRYLGALILFGLVANMGAQEARKYSCTDRDRSAAEEYLSRQAENDAVAEDARRPRKGTLPFCWHSCAVSLPMPWYPRSAKRLAVQGVVTLYTIADEDGRIFYAQPISGPKMLRQPAREAACKSVFKPIHYGARRLKFPWTIKYNFQKDTNAQVL